MTTKIAELAGRELKWVQPHVFKMEYELQDGDSVVAALRFRSSFGSFATAETAEGSWTFKRVGFWQTRVTIRASGTETDLAAFHTRTWSGGGTLEFPDGRKYPVNSNFWETEYEFKTETGEPLITFRRIGGVFHLSSTMEIHPAATRIAELPWMVPLGWYLAVMMNSDNVAAAAAIVAAG